MERSAENFLTEDIPVLEVINPKQRAWLEVDSKKIKSNTEIITKLIGKDCLLMAVVKADGYGHGVEAVARAALSGGATSLGVATLREGIQLRTLNISCPILVLGNLIEQKDLQICLNWDLMPTLSGFREALFCQNIAAAENKQFSVHIKVDTGMTRLGCDFNEVMNLVGRVDELPNVSMEGIYSHLACADCDPSSPLGFTNKSQREKFETIVRTISKDRKSLIFHLANSAGTLLGENFHFDMVRVGLSLYGYDPFRSHDSFHALQPAMSVKAKVTLIRDVPSNVGVGYGHFYRTTTNRRLAVVGIGYADGVSRALSGKISVLFDGKRFPQMGSIAMDQLVIDVTDCKNISIGSTVTLIGESGTESINAKHWSDLLGSIPWEVLCGFKNRLPRLVV